MKNSNLRVQSEIRQPKPISSPAEIPDSEFSTFSFSSVFLCLCGRFSPSPERRKQRGFTLIEMMVVLSIMLILLAIALPSYSHSIVRAREGVLKQDLFTLRSCINQYTEDKQKAPQSLEDLVSGGYLKQLPLDPFTNSNSTWQVVQEDILDSIDQQEPGISDVHSGSNQSSLEGNSYSEW
jgi:general secretion pathway protein G